MIQRLPVTIRNLLALEAPQHILVTVLAKELVMAPDVVEGRLLCALGAAKVEGGAADEFFSLGAFQNLMVANIVVLFLALLCAELLHDGTSQNWPFNRWNALTI